MVSIYQGNDKTFVFTRRDVENNVITSIPKERYFSVKEDYDSNNVLINKRKGRGIEQNEDGSWSIKINAIDTSSLNPGKYVCDVKIINEIGDMYHVVRPQEFVIAEVVTK